ncbi:hypothetical protein CNYM01_00481 [Colletotrichum nymphaeae SA-01]|uniref:Uncharacterized protein n=1 Tax=Colletotrichum nymphaeae SA-01 TaxID=1460502 RepID=A0A135TVE7_9PEZI|nr:hypothetical protein CNYM01_00481 [Colletotrichum nymphaeae SA-01]
MAQASPSWQRLLGLLSVLLALILGVSAGEHGAAVTGCPADLASAPEHTFSAGFDNSTDVAETQAERSHVEKLAATSLHGMGMLHLNIPCVLGSHANSLSPGARSSFEAFRVEIPASCNTPSMKSSLIELPISFASLHMHLQNIRTK